MPPPSNVAELLDRVRRSGVVTPERLDRFLVNQPQLNHPATTTTQVLDCLLDAGLITRFHADKFAIGKYKGFQLGSYLILDQLGAGSYGQVYLAQHINMNRFVALKVLSPQVFDNDNVARERFLREARAAGTLNHPNIVRVFDLCQDGKLLYLVLEYVEGVSVQSLVARTGALDVYSACHYGWQLAFGLQHAHELGFVHRDIRPANLLVDRHGIAKILDFGLVRSEGDIEGDLTKQAGGNHVLGAADYISPEQAVDSSHVDIRTDIYSLGATMYFMLAARTLFPEGRAPQKMISQQFREPMPLSRLRPDVPHEIAGIIHWMLRKRPEDRPQTPAEVFEALTPFVEEDAPAPAPAWLPERHAVVARVHGNAPLSGVSLPQTLTPPPSKGPGRRNPTPSSAETSPIDSSAETARLGVTPSGLNPNEPVFTALSDSEEPPFAEEEYADSPAEPAESQAKRSKRVAILLVLSLILSLASIAILLFQQSK